MNIVILFINIGYYHYARLKAASESCGGRGWRVIGMQVTGSTLRHPWGALADNPNIPLITMQSESGSHVTPEGKIPSISARRVHECLEEIRPDVVFLPGWSFEICRQCLAWCKKRSIPVVLMSESKYDDEPRFWLKERLKKWRYVRHFDAALVGGESHKDYAAYLGISRDRIITGYDIVDNLHFERGADHVRHDPAEGRKAFPEIPRRPYFIAVTRFVPRKNILGLVRAYAQYVNLAAGGEESWDLVICGNGPQLDAVWGEVSRLDLGSRVHLPGFLPYSAVPAWYGMAGAFVHPALQEQWGLVVNEACASGLPVIVSKTVGSSCDLVADARNGFLVDPTDIGDISDKLSLISRLGDESLRMMGDYSRDLARKLAPERFGDGVVRAVLSLKGATA